MIKCDFLVHIDEHGRHFYCTKSAIIFHMEKDFAYASCKIHSPDPQSKYIITEEEYIVFTIMYS